jgi:hypothetical protein
MQRGGRLSETGARTQQSNRPDEGSGNKNHHRKGSRRRAHLSAGR